VSISLAALNAATPALHGLQSQLKTNFQSLLSDVQSGDLSGAQSAFTSLQNAFSGAQGVGGATQGTGVQPVSQLRTDVANLISSIQVGSISGAQTALAAGGAASATTAKSSFSQDLANLIQAVRSGNLTSAQQGVTPLQSDMQSQGAGHHHHHRAATNTSIASPAATSSTSSPSSASAYASVMNFQAGTAAQVSTQA
jgi:hypothetical protein